MFEPTAVLKFIDGELWQMWREMFVAHDRSGNASWAPTGQTEWRKVPEESEAANADTVSPRQARA